MKNKERSLFVAYIVFLCVCFVIKIINISIPGLLVDWWNRLVAATTVSTICFCAADVFCLRREINTLIDVYYAPLDEKRKRLEKRLNMPTGDAVNFKDQFVCQYVEELRADVHELVQPYQFPKTKKVSIASILNMCGFCIFLFITFFDGIYKLFFPIQDVLTMLAFIVVLITVSYKDAKMNKLQTEIQVLDMELDKHSLALALTEIEDCLEGVKKDGKNENADMQ